MSTTIEISLDTRPILSSVELTLRFQTRSTNQKSVDIALLRQLLTVRLADRTAVKDPRTVSSFLRDVLPQPFSDGGMDFLCLLFCSYLTGPDGP